jgi:hypothetical protein
LFTAQLLNFKKIIKLKENGVKKKIVFGPTFLNHKNGLPREEYFNKSTVYQKHDFQQFSQKTTTKNLIKK